MNRRDHLKTLFATTAGAGLASTGLPACVADPDTDVSQATQDAADPLSYLTPHERLTVAKVETEDFFTDFERATIVALAHRVLPASEHGGIEEAGVPEFIEFRTKEIDGYRIPMRGGLAWLNGESQRRFGEAFAKTAPANQTVILDEVAYHDAEVPEGQRPPEQQFFNLFRNLVLTGYFTSAVGIADLQYKGNAPNQWDGVPQEVLDKHGVAYDPVWIAKCVDHETSEAIAEWDEEGNLIT